MKDIAKVCAIASVGLAVAVAACSDGEHQAPHVVDVGVGDVHGADDASTPDADVPTGLLPYHARVSTGYNHTCALEADGTANCFGLGTDPDAHEGLNDFDQAVEPRGRFVQVSAGTIHSCGLRLDGSVECWGMGSDPDNVEEPDMDYDQAHPPGGDFIAVETNLFYSCGIRADRALYCWGATGREQFMEDHSFAQISAGWAHFCGVTTDKRVVCHGSGDDPDADEGEYDFDQSVPPEGEFLQVSAGYLHTCALRTDNTIECWGLGSDSSAEEGDFDFDQAVPPDGEFQWVSSGYYHSCGVKADGDIECWGYGAGTYAGDSRDFGQARIRQGPFVEVSASAWHTCGVHESGSVECWGKNGLGQADPLSKYGADGCARVDHGEFGLFTCSPLCQRGCGDGEACSVSRRADEGWITVCIDAGDGQEGDECSPGNDLCSAGLACLYDGNEARCRQICRRDSSDAPQCPANQTCEGELPVGTCQPS